MLGLLLGVALAAEPGQDLESRTLGTLKWVPPGAFLMGAPAARSTDDEEPPHEVRLTRGFHMMATEVTQRMYARLMGDNPSTPFYQQVSLLGDDLPVQNVSWLDALAFANAASKADGLTPCYVLNRERPVWRADCTGYRLPTEAEWERAARGGGVETFAGTSDLDAVCRYANVGDATRKVAFPHGLAFSCDDGSLGPSRAGSYLPNAYGLYDMTGNMSEWVWELYYRYPSDAVVDPVGSLTGSPPDARHIRRGGDWASVEINATVFRRMTMDDLMFTGFRLVSGPVTNSEQPLAWIPPTPMPQPIWTKAPNVWAALPTGWLTVLGVDDTFRHAEAGLQVELGVTNDCLPDSEAFQIPRPDYVDAGWTRMVTGPVDGQWALAMCRPSPASMVHHISTTRIIVSTTTGAADLAQITDAQRAELTRALPLFAEAMEQIQRKGSEMAVHQLVVRGKPTYLGMRVPASLPPAWLDTGPSDFGEGFVHGTAGVTADLRMSDIGSSPACTFSVGRAIPLPPGLGPEWSDARVIEDGGVEMLGLCRLHRIGNLRRNVQLGFIPTLRLIDFDHMPEAVATAVRELTEAISAAAAAEAGMYGR